MKKSTKKIMNKIKNVGATIGFALMMFGAAGMDSKEILIPAVICAIGLTMMLISTKM